MADGPDAVPLTPLLVRVLVLANATAALMQYPSVKLGPMTGSVLPALLGRPPPADRSLTGARPNPPVVTALAVAATVAAVVLHVGPIALTVAG